MGYFSRLILGIVITITGYYLLQDSYNRNHFHRSAQKLLNAIDLSTCYCLIESVRVGIVGFVITSGVVLAFDVCVSMAVLAEIMMVGKGVLQFSQCNGLCSVQNVMMHAVILLVLLSNLCENCQKPTQNNVAPSSSPVQQAPTVQQPKPVQNAPKTAPKAQNNPTLAKQSSAASSTKQKKK